PPTLVEACEHLGLPLIRVPYDTPFIAITRAAARLIEAAMHAQNIDRLTRSDRTPATRITSAEAALRSAIVSLLIRGDREHAEAIAAPLYPRLPRGQVAVIALRAGDGDLSPQDLGEGITSGVHDGKLIVICESAHV